jgi:type IV pilus assembly protein PilW
MVHEKKSIYGFTLVELMIAMVISAIVMAAIYSVYYTQQKSYLAQEQVAAMQQNLRAGMSIMTRDIRMAGYDPNGTYNAGMTTGASNLISFTREADSGTTVETIQYEIYDSLGDGINDLGRRLNGNLDPIAEHIDALDLVYLDGNGGILSTPLSGGDLSLVRSVQVTMVARAGRGDPGFVNNDDYRNQQGTTVFTAPGDNIRRKVLSRQIKCRNLGL